MLPVVNILGIKDHPPQQLEWDQKLWWVHFEALVCMAKAYQLTGNEKAKAWFERVYEYGWNNFGIKSTRNGLDI